MLSWVRRNWRKHRGTARNPEVNELKLMIRLRSGDMDNSDPEDVLAETGPDMDKAKCKYVEM